MNSKYPPKPEEVLPSDCCGNGCTPCVLDIYDQELEIWKRQCEDLENPGRLSNDNHMHKNVQEDVMRPDLYQSYKVVSLELHTKDSYTFRFQLKPYEKLPIQLGQHLIMRWNRGDGTITRQYTPISDSKTMGYFEVVIKIYEEGKMSEYIRHWVIGSSVEWRGPCGQFHYKPNQFDNIVLLAAGTGIAPMTQIIRHILDVESDETVIYLLYSVKCYRDIICRSLIDDWKGYWNFKLLLYVTQERDVKIEKFAETITLGRINERSLQNVLGEDLKKSYFCICGTKSFDLDMINILKSLDVESDRIHKF